MEKPTPLYIQLLNYMNEMGSPVTKKEIMNTCGIIKDSTLHSLVNYINNKTYPNKLLYSDSGYYKLNKDLYEKHIKGGTENRDLISNEKRIEIKHPVKKKEDNKNIPQVRLTKKDVDIIVPDELLVELKIMNPSDMNDAIELFKKAYFYKKCAMDLIESSKISNSVKEVLSQREPNL